MIREQAVQGNIVQTKIEKKMINLSAQIYNIYIQWIMSEELGEKNSFCFSLMNEMFE